MLSRQSPANCGVLQSKPCAPSIAWTPIHTHHIPYTKWGPIEQTPPESKRGLERLNAKPNGLLLRSCHDRQHVALAPYPHLHLCVAHIYSTLLYSTPLHFTLPAFFYCIPSDVTIPAGSYHTPLLEGNQPYGHRLIQPQHRVPKKTYGMRLQVVLAGV